MPSSIPFDSSLVLGEIIKKDRIEALMKISAAQAPIDAAQEKLNNYLKTKRSLDMTRLELVNLNIDDKALKEIDDAMVALDKDIADAAKDYVKKSATGLKNVAEAKTAAGAQANGSMIAY